jgi:O-antigen/teichoic acid export membrane protein
MPSVLHNIVKHSSVYSLGNVLSKSIAFLLIPLYTRYLTPSDYGDLEILSITGQLLMIFCGMGLGTGLIRAYLLQAADDNERRIAATSAHAFILISSILFYGLLILGVSQISRIAFGEIRHLLGFIVLFVTGAVQCNTIIPMQIYRAELKSVRYTLISLLQFSVILGSSIYFVVVREMNVLGILYANLLGAIVLLAGNLSMIRRYFLPKLSFALLKKMLRFGLPFVPAALALWLIASLDRYFLVHWADAHELGLYSMGFRFATILELIFREPFDTNWPSIYFPLAKQSGSQREFAKIFSYYLMTGLFLCLVLSVFARPAIQLMTTPAFYEAEKVVPLLALAILFRGLSSNLGVGIGISGKSEFDALAVAATAVCNAALNFLLIPDYGMMGAAMATALSFFGMAVISYLISQRLFPIAYETARISKAIAAFVLPLAVFYSVNFSKLAWEIVLALALCASYFPLLLLLNFFTPEEKAQFRAFIEKKTFLPVMMKSGTR